MILSLYQTKDGKIAYSKILKNLNDISHGSVTKNELKDIDTFGIELLAINDTAPKELKDIASKTAKDLGVPLEIIDHKEALLTANWMNLGNESLNEISFPHIAFVDADNSTSIFVVDSPTKYKIISNINDKSLSKHLKELEEMMKIQKLEETAIMGDETSEIFSTDVELKEENVFELMKKIFSDAQKIYDKLPKSDTGNNEVDVNMDEFTKADFASSFQEALVKYLIIRIFEAAGDTGISLITLSGNFSKNSRFREMSIRLASNVKYDIRFPEAGHYDNPSIAIGARAFLNKYGQIKI